MNKGEDTMTEDPENEEIMHRSIEPKELSLKRSNYRQILMDP